MESIANPFAKWSFVYFHPPPFTRERLFPSKGLALLNITPYYVTRVTSDCYVLELIKTFALATPEFYPLNDILMQLVFWSTKVFQWKK